MKVAPTREGIRSEDRLESRITRFVLPWREGKEIPSEALPEEVILGVDSMEKMNRPCGGDSRRFCRFTSLDFHQKIRG
jgi:hypothetical protein